MAILMLKAFAGESGSSGSTANQESPGLLIARGPGKITHPLQAKHRIKNVKRNHGNAMIAVGGRGRNPLGHGAGFGDAFLQYLTLYIFAVIHQLICVFGKIQLSFRRVDAQLAEHTLHAEGA